MPNLTSPLDVEELILLQKTVQKVFFYRVCGTGMGAAASLLKLNGYNVEGGDNLFYPPMSDELNEAGIVTWTLDEVKDDYLSSFDLIVVGNVVGKESADAERIRKLGVPYSSFPAVLGAFVLKDRNVVGIAGTHGKTTTTYLATQIFEKCRLDPGYLIGGVIEKRGSTRLGSKDYFFIESDEYDSAFFHKRPKFHYYQLKSVLLTSVEFDHADIYKNLDEIEVQFRDLLMQIEDTIICNIDYPSILKLIKEVEEFGKAKKIIPYGIECSNGPKNIHTTTEGTNFDLHCEGKVIPIKTNLFGRHNLLNLSAALIYALNRGIEEKLLIEASRELEMVMRRQEVKFTKNRWIFVDDFAHHPTAVKETHASILARYPDYRLTTVFAPLSATARSSIFQQEFAKSLVDAEEILILRPDKKTSVKEADDLDCERLLKDLLKLGVKRVEMFKDGLLAAKYLDGYEKEDKRVILVLSNGNMQSFWEHFNN